ncbi:MAG: LLM class flavin-dependent oxidoreductase [Hyphomicrobiaceae bacterium]
MTFPLSLLDQSPIIGQATPAEAIQRTIELARLADRLGFHRYWCAEHHSLTGLADASPEILLARLGAETKHIRLGTGGIMLPYYAPFKIAEQFKMLEALYPGRIDLGLGRAPGGHPRTARVLFDGRPVDTDEGFANQLAELSAMFRDIVPTGHPLENQIVSPAVPTSPEMWVLGSSTGGASFAASLGMRFAFAHFINAYSGAEVAKAYRQHFRAWHEETPRVALAMLCLCAEDEAEQKAIEKAVLMRWALTALGENRPVPTIEDARDFEFGARELQIANHDRPRLTLGKAADVAAKIRQTAEAFEADEVILVSIAPSYELRIKTLEALAKEFDLKPRDV